MTKLQKATKEAMQKWFSKQGHEIVGRIRHIYPRAYIIAKPAPLCIVVMTPYQDAEKHMRNKKYRSATIIHSFEEGLEAGDWCSLAYVSRKGISQSYAIKCVVS